MSIKSEIERIKGNVTASLSAVASKGVTVPSGSTSDDLPTLISSISTQSGGGGTSYQPRNFLVNSDFSNPVNQRGQETYTGSGEYTYTIDRWIVENNDTISITTSDDPQTVFGLGKHIEVSAGLMQYYTADWRDIGNDGIVTFAACDTDGNISCVTSTGEFTGGLIFSSDERIVMLDALATYDDGSAISMVGLLSGSWNWAAVYPGSYTVDTLPPYVPKGYVTEFLECSRYYRSYVSRFTPVAMIAAGTARMTVHLPVPMRTTPTATLLNADNIIMNNGSGKVLTVTGASVDSMENCNVYIDLSCNSTSSELYGVGSTFLTNIALDAELYDIM